MVRKKTKQDHTHILEHVLTFASHWHLFDSLKCLPIPSPVLPLRGPDSEGRKAGIPDLILATFSG